VHSTEYIRTRLIALDFILRLVQFRAHRSLQGSHIGGHIVYFYNVLAGEREFAGVDVWEDGDEEMGPV